MVFRLVLALFVATLLTVAANAWADLPADDSATASPTESPIPWPHEEPGETAFRFNPEAAPLELESAPGDAKEAAAAKKALQKKVAGAYKGLYYDNDFSYLCDPAYHQHHLGEWFKRRTLGCCGWFDLGGEYRARYHSEHNMRGLGLTGRSDDFLLHRTRLFANAQIAPQARVYVEYLDAVSFHERHAPRPIEENRSDLLNAFVDGVLIDDASVRLSGRIGRQELLYGDQRLISPLDWANTRRTFEGAKLMWEFDEWNLDAFWVRPVIPDEASFDSPDHQQELYGAWATRNYGEAHTLDLYWLGYHNYESPFPEGESYKLQTCGARWHARHGALQTLLQGAYQFGRFGDQDHSAGFFVTGLGRSWSDALWQPTCWVYYDWASGDEALGNGFNQLFPLGHKYLGLMDFFARTNIQDLNCQFILKPAEKLTFLIWWHAFWLQNSQDVAYNVVGRPIVNQPGGSRYLGQEIDLLLTWKVGPRTEVVTGYSHFFTGDWYRTNPAASQGFTGDADFFYLQVSQQF